MSFNGAHMSDLPPARMMKSLNRDITSAMEAASEHAAQTREMVQGFCDNWGLDYTGLAIAHRIMRKAVGEHANPAKARAIYDTLIFALSKQGWDFDSICPPSLFSVDNVEHIGDHREAEEVA